MTLCGGPEFFGNFFGFGTSCSLRDINVSDVFLKLRAETLTRVLKSCFAVCLDYEMQDF